MTEPESPAARSDRSPWNWLLAIPIVLPLLTPIYNFNTPRLWGFPAFYWVQFLFILVGVVTTSLVYQMTKRPGRATSAAAPVSPAPSPAGGDTSPAGESPSGGESRE
jgi:uncharacterized SAM-binding protein YcdF (DUF218 family)